MLTNHRAAARTHTRRFGRALPVLAALVAVIMVAGVVGGFTDSLAKQKERDASRNDRPQKQDRLPPMDFLSGVLSSDSKGNWELGNVPLVFNKGSLVFSEDDPEEPTQPVEGRQVTLMGSWAGGSFVVRLATVKRMSWVSGLESEPLEKIKSIDPKSDPARTPH